MKKPRNLTGLSWLFAKNEKEIDALVQTVRGFNGDIGMQFGMEKCATSTLRTERRVDSNSILLPD